MLKRLHRWNAAILGLYLAAHLANHAVLVLGVDAHLAVMSALGRIYRVPPVEVILLALLAVQIALGLALALRRGRPREGWAWAQVLSGLYLVFFLIQHVPAVLLARRSDMVPETDSHFAAAVLSEPLFAAYFGPYYVLAVTAIFTHLAAAWRFAIWPRPAHAGHIILPVAGLALGLMAVLVLSGVWGDYTLPPAYAAYLEQFRQAGQ